MRLWRLDSVCMVSVCICSVCTGENVWMAPTCRPMGPGGPGKPLEPSSPFCPNIPCWPLGPGSPSAPWEWKTHAYSLCVWLLGSTTSTDITHCLEIQTFRNTTDVSSLHISSGLSFHFICEIHSCFEGHVYLQQDLGHLWDLGDQLGQEDPEYKQEKVAATSSYKGTQVWLSLLTVW